MTPTILSDRLLEFAVEIGKITNDMPRSYLGRHIAGQLVRSGTSPGPNYEEAQAASSKRDFVYRMSICQRELRESRFWLKLIHRSSLLNPSRVAPIANECDQLCRIFTKSILTAKTRPK